MLDALIVLGVDKVVESVNTDANMILATWLKRASEAGFSKAWPAYGRVLRLSYLVSVPNAVLEIHNDSALKWLRKSHEAGDIKGTLELALWLIEKLAFASEAGQGERMLRHAAQKDIEARYELGMRLLEGKHLATNEVEGFEHLLSLAEGGHAAAKLKLDSFFCSRFAASPTPHIDLPTCTKPYQSRLEVLFPKYPFRFN